MKRLRQLFFIFALSVLLFGRVRAQSNLTQISDNVLNPDGSPFNGTVVISWTGSGTATGSSPAPYGTSVKIYNGVLSVSLVPSVTASNSAFYLAVFNSKDGRLSWVETWQVGISSAPLALSQVRTNVSTTPTSSGTSTIAIGQVTGLGSYLNALSSSLTTVTSSVSGFNSTVSGLTSSVTNLTNIVNGLTTSQNSTSGEPTFFDGEVPQGTINGRNTVFNLTNAPTPVSSLSLFRNGILQKAGTDYTLSGSTLTFLNVSVPQTGDLLQASYRTGTSGQSKFVDNQVPGGTINGINLTFSLSVPPSPASSLRVYRNGILLMQNADYTLSGSTINFVNTRTTPTYGDSLVSFYRIAN